MPMTIDIFDSIVDAVFDECKRILKEKGASQTRGSGNKLANFERQAARRGQDPRAVIATYQDKHRDAIDGFVFEGVPTAEPVESHFTDDINYALLQLAECIAVGYVPETEWLFEALCKGAGITVEEGREALAKVQQTTPATPPDEAEQPSESTEAPTPIRPDVDPSDETPVDPESPEAHGIDPDEEQAWADAGPPSDEEAAAEAPPTNSEQFEKTGEVCCNPGGSQCCDGGGGELKPGAQVTRDGRTTGVRHARGRVKSRSKQAAEKAGKGDKSDE